MGKHTETSHNKDCHHSEPLIAEHTKSENIEIMTMSRRISPPSTTTTTTSTTATAAEATTEITPHTPLPHKENQQTISSNSVTKEASEHEGGTTLKGTLPAHGKNDDEQLEEEKTAPSSSSSSPVTPLLSTLTDRERKEEKGGGVKEEREEEKKEEEKEEEKEKSSDTTPDHSGLPVDRGWAWVIMICQFVMTSLMMGYGRSLSIFFMEFLIMFEVPVTTATLVFGLMTACFGIGNLLLSHVLLSRFTARRLQLTGAVINALSIALTAIAPNMIFVAVTHCFLGFAHALIFVPGYTLLGHYFHKRRSFAMAVANTGLSISALVFPPFTQFLITYYGTRGALLLVAGIELQCIVAASLMRPVSWYTKGTKKAASPSSAEAEGEAPRACLQKGEVAETKVCSNGFSNKKDLDGNKAEGETTKRLLDDVDHRETRMNFALQQVAASSSSHHPFTQLSASLPEKSALSESSSDLYHRHHLPEESSHRNRLPVRAYGRQQSCPAPENGLRTAARQESVVSDSSSSVRFARLTSSVVDVCGSTMNITTAVVTHSSSNEKRPEEDEGEEGGVRKEGGWCWRCGRFVMTNIMDVSLFKNWLFLLILVYIPLGFSAGFLPFYFPALAVEKGLSRSEAALLISVMGGVDLVSRLCVGYVADLAIVKRTHMVAICMTIMGITSHFCRLFTGIGLLAMFSVVYGLVGGVCNNLYAVVIIDLLGLPLLGKVMGLVLLFNSIFTSLNHIVIGALVDSTGSFDVTYNYVGASLLLSSIVLLMEPLARRLETKRVRRLQTDADCGRDPVKA